MTLSGQLKARLFFGRHKHLLHFFAGVAHPLSVLQARKFALGSCIRSVVWYGGTSVGFQLRTLMSGCNILIATPGRLCDFVEKGKVKTDMT